MKNQYDKNCLFHPIALSDTLLFFVIEFLKGFTQHTMRIFESYAHHDENLAD
jgi:hypothetical protein